jgi:hypothetical protein
MIADPFFSHTTAMSSIIKAGRFWTPIWSSPPSNTSSNTASPIALEQGDDVIHPFVGRKEKFFGIHQPKGATSSTWSVVSRR